MNGWPVQCSDFVTTQSAAYREHVQLQGQRSRSQGKLATARLCEPSGIMTQERNDKKFKFNAWLCIAK